MKDRFSQILHSKLRIIEKLDTLRLAYTSKKLYVLWNKLQFSFYRL